MFGRTQVPSGRRYYTCSGQHSEGRTRCDAGQIRMEPLDDLVVEGFLERYGESAQRERFLDGYLAGLADEREILRSGWSRSWGNSSDSKIRRPACARRTGTRS